jgi:hypothetical protein
MTPKKRTYLVTHHGQTFTRITARHYEYIIIERPPGGDIWLCLCWCGNFYRAETQLRKMRKIYVGNEVIMIPVDNQ